MLTFIRGQGWVEETETRPYEPDKLHPRDRKPYPDYYWYIINEELREEAGNWHSRTSLRITPLLGYSFDVELWDDYKWVLVEGDCDHSRATYLINTQAIGYIRAIRKT